jgi:5-methylcytosine-specific restriction protein A
MPNAPKRPCGYPGCPNLCDSGRCEKHTKQERHDYDARRQDDPQRKIYCSARWRRLRAAKLAADPLCERCKQADILEGASDVHHIKDIRDGGDPWDWGNLASLCHRCHSAEGVKKRWGSV